MQDCATLRQMMWDQKITNIHKNYIIDGKLKLHLFYKKLSLELEMNLGLATIPQWVPPTFELGVAIEEFLLH